MKNFTTMTNSLFSIAIAGLLMGATACVASDESTSQQGGPLSGDDTEHCEDPVNCDGSEPSGWHPVQDPVAPEEDDDYEPNGVEVECDGFDSNGNGIDECSGDADHDGTVATYDCDDHDPTRYTAAPEVLCDGIDQNCDGIDPCDSDHDFVLDQNDCDPHDPRVTTECHNEEPPVPLD